MFGKLKQAMGIGTVKVEVKIPASAEKATLILSGTVELTAKSDQEVEGLSVHFKESYSTGRGTEKKIRQFDLGQTKLPEKFAMKTGEVKEIAFAIPYKLRKSGNDQLKDYGGALGTLGKLNSIIEAESSEFFVYAEVSVKGVITSPSDRKNIDLV